MKKFSLSILFGIISILSIYASSEIDLPTRTLVSSPVVFQDNYNLIFETSGFCHSVIMM